jgi:hypothetical protein
MTVKPVPGTPTRRAAVVIAIRHIHYISFIVEDGLGGDGAETIIMESNIMLTTGFRSAYTGYHRWSTDPRRKRSAA